MRDHLPNEKCPICEADMSWGVEGYIGNKGTELMRRYSYVCWKCGFKIEADTEADLEAKLDKMRKKHE